MKKFSFPLDKLRAWRESRLEAEIRTLESLLTGKTDLERRRSQLADEDRTSQERLRNSPILNVDNLVTVDVYRGWTQRECVKLQSQIAELDQRIAAQRHAVLEARRGVEVLVRLRTARFEQWKRDFERESESAVAELAVARWAAGQAG